MAQQHGPSGSSGAYFGDSGGPIFWVDPASGSETAVAIVVGPVGGLTEHQSRLSRSTIGSIRRSLSDSSSRSSRPRASDGLTQTVSAWACSHRARHARSAGPRDRGRPRPSRRACAAPGVARSYRCRKRVKYRRARSLSPADSAISARSSRSTLPIPLFQAAITAVGNMDSYQARRRTASVSSPSERSHRAASRRFAVTSSG